jgi:uncharacterized membrane protein
VYSWLWRVLPGGLPGKLLLSFLLALAVVALLFFVVFPAVEPLVPFGDVTVDAESASG